MVKWRWRRKDLDGMATETFFKEIIINDEAADILIAEIEKPRKPHVPEFDILDELEEGKKWLKERRLRKLSEQSTK
jgi:hypothetical protein